MRDGSGDIRPSATAKCHGQVPWLSDLLNMRI